MRNGLIILLILLFNLGAAPSLAADPELANLGEPAKESAQKPAIPQRGSLYRVRYHDHIGYLFGTIHVGRPEFFPLEAQATQALAEAGTLALELDMRDTAALQSAVQKYGMYAAIDSVDKHLSPASLKRLKAALAELNIPYPRVAQMKTWMVANLLLVAALEQLGYHTDLATETYLTKSAAAQGKAVVGLESADLQLSLFDNMTEKQQEQYLNDNLDDLQSGDMRKKTQELIDAWATADENAFEHILNEAQSDQTTAGKFFLRTLLAKRNPVMASKIESMLKEDKASFVGIGLLHLVGADGVPQLLSKRGYEVTRLY